MPMLASLELTGATLGTLKGSARQGSRKGHITVTAFEHLIRSERNPDELTKRGGTPTERRVHGTFVVTKDVDQATPRLREALAKGEVFSRFQLHCYRVPPAGGGPNNVFEENHWTVFLSGARVAAVRMVMPTAGSAATQSIDSYEEVEFTYEKIGFLWKALTGNGANVSTGETPAFDADFANSDEAALLQAVASDLGKDLGKQVAKEVTDGIKAAASELTKPK
jgi:type VI secretion system secreted protein Hcp